MHVQLEGVSRIFGPEPQRAFAALRDGQDKSQVLASTGHVVGVHEVSLTIDRGELFVVMGLSGSGKSTLVRMINRLIEPTRGRVLIDGEDVTAMPPRQLIALRREKISMVFQSFALLPQLSVLDNVAFGLDIAGVARDEARRRAGQALELVGVSDVADHRPYQLSGGMQQRVGLARAWVTEPEIMLMDEAFSALDPLIRAEMQDALLALQRTTRPTVIFVSHDLAEAARIADRVAVMANGEVRQVATPIEMLDRPADDYVEAFFRDVQPARLFRAADIALPCEGAAGLEPVRADMLLEDILPRAAQSRQPLPVVDADGRIIGCIDHARLLQTLARTRRG